MRMEITDNFRSAFPLGADRCEQRYRIDLEMPRGIGGDIRARPHFGNMIAGAEQQPAHLKLRRRSRKRAEPFLQLA